MTVSKRGISYSVGGKGARLTKRADGRIQSTAHLAPGLSYTSTTHSHTRKQGAASRQNVGTSVSGAAQARAQAARTIIEATEFLTTFHHRDYPEATEPVVPPPAPVDQRAVARELSKQAAKDINWWHRFQRRHAKGEALASLPTVVTQREAQAASAHAEDLRAAQAAWNALMANDASAVVEAVTDAFRGYEVQTCALASDNPGHAAIALVYSGIEVIPEQKAGTTGTGRPTLVKRSQTERNTLYMQAMCSMIVDACRKAVAAAPRINELGVAMMRKTPIDIEPLYFGQFPGPSIREFTSTTDPVRAANTFAVEAFRTRGQAHEVVSLGEFTNVYARSLFDTLSQAARTGARDVEVHKTIEVSDPS